MVKIHKSELIKYPHGFSTRIGGVSRGIYASLNLGMNRGDVTEDVTTNWKLFLDETGIGYKPFVCGRQVHGNTVHIAERKDAREAFGPGELITADGYVTNIKGLPLAIFTADCLPVLMEDIKAGVVGAIHCGWRSTVADIEKNAVDAFLSLGADPKDIKVAIGPAIRACCFEVGAEVIDAVTELIGKGHDDLYNLKANGKYMLDLGAVVAVRMMQLGIREENIEIVGECTMCNPDIYYSHRYSNGARGSLACAISIN